MTQYCLLSYGLVVRAVKRIWVPFQLSPNVFFSILGFQVVGICFIPDRGHRMAIGFLLLDIFFRKQILVANSFVTFQKKSFDVSVLV